jgi:hypothetical protein
MFPDHPGLFLGWLALLLGAMSPAGQERAGQNPDRLLKEAIQELLKLEEAGGEWPYEGVYRVGGQIPLGYRAGGTALVAGAILLGASPEDPAARAAVGRGLDFVLGSLGDPRLAPSTEDAYDVRVWGQACALEFLCLVRGAQKAGARAEAVDLGIPRLVRTLAEEELPGGGWNYTGRRASASFVTAPVVQALLWARSQGTPVPEGLFERARKSLESARTEAGAFLYSGTFKPGESRFTGDHLEGSIARSPACETTLCLLGGGSPKAVQGALDAFSAHWQELESRRKKTGTHQGPYQIAPYYFYYGHRYAAQAIQCLPLPDRARERERVLALLLKTRDPDGTWNDRVFPRSRNYGTAMATLALLGEKAAVPPAWKKE